MKQMYQRIKTLASFFCIVMLPSVGSAQWQSEASLSTSIESNALRSSIPSKDRITERTLYVAHQWGGAELKGLLSCQLNSLTFADLAEHNYSVHSFGLTGQYDFAQSGWLRSGLQAKIRQGSETYTTLDYSEFEGFLDARIPFENYLTVVTGYTLRRRDYRVVSELDNREHLLYGGVTVPFSDGTSVNLLTEGGYKFYSVPVSNAAVSGNPVGDAAKVGQWVNTVRLSRPLLENLGLMVYGRGRKNLGDKDVYISGLSSGYSSENDLYDDRYGYESVELGGMLSCQLAHTLLFRIGYDYADKKYQQMPLDLDGNVIAGVGSRGDTVKQLWCRAEKRFSFAGNQRQLTLYSEYTWLNNDSNDTSFRYKASSMTVGVDVVF